MNKTASVIFAYTPKNDDELELTVGDKIEVIGVDEEGWLRGKLRGRIGVFPENFVQVLEQQTISATTTPLVDESSRPKPIRSLGTANGMFFTPPTPNSVAGVVKGNNTNSIGGRPLPAAMASERVGVPSLANTLQKPIPKKPPPPAPTDSNGSQIEQAPALPPKPTGPYNRPQRLVQEQARVIYEYKPRNDDELEMEVGDIINVIDKNIEDAGWWKGELNGKVGVFPDNFVQLISSAHIPAPVAAVAATTTPPVTTTAAAAAAGAVVAESCTKVKSVFAGTPKGFSKELENNLERHNNPASFLSLKRNKLHQQQSLPGLPCDSTTPVASMTTASDEKSNGDTIGPLETTSSKLNHITINRAKGPSRRPPSNIISKRNQSVELGSVSKEDSLFGPSKGVEPSLAANAALPITKAQPQSGPQVDKLASDQNSSPVSPLTGQQKLALPTAATVPTPAPTTHTTATNNNNISGNNSYLHNSASVESPLSTPIKPSISLDNVLDSRLMGLPKTSQRISQSIEQQQERPKTVSATAPTPPWMVELRKTNAEKKRDPITISNLENEVGLATNNVETPATPPQAPAPVNVEAIPAPNVAASSNGHGQSPIIQRSPQAVLGKLPPLPIAATTPTTVVNKTNEHLDAAVNEVASVLSKAQLDNLARQISKDVMSEINSLRSDVKRLQDELDGMIELKQNYETMKTELKACQTATENQKRYIKELVNNLADERSKIAALQQIL